jgi:outer membrane receptor protein involved in Fe transport
LSLLHSSRRGFYGEIRAIFTGRQERLTGGDLDDERIGASRSRRDIAAFFASATAAPFISEGVFVPTGETLAQIQERVLPGTLSETARVPLYNATAGWARVDVMGGFPVGERTTIQAGVMNLFDRSYRVHGSGVDGLGTNVLLRVRYTFH